MTLAMAAREIASSGLFARVFLDSDISSRERWRECFADEEMAWCMLFCSRRVSVPHIQNWPAVRELKLRGLLGLKCIANWLSGYRFDTLAWCGIVDLATLGLGGDTYSILSSLSLRAQYSAKDGDGVPGSLGLGIGP
jgi:hypothetical protein